MFTLLVVINSYSIFTGLGCLICLIFLFFESAFGICLGCLVYPLFYKKQTKHCAGEVCEVIKKQEIQNTFRVQIFILLLLVAFVILLFIFINNSFSKNPVNLWSIISFKRHSTKLLYFIYSLAIVDLRSSRLTYLRRCCMFHHYFIKKESMLVSTFVGAAYAQGLLNTNKGGKS